MNYRARSGKVHRMVSRHHESGFVTLGRTACKGAVFDSWVPTTDGLTCLTCRRLVES